VRSIQAAGLTSTFAVDLGVTPARDRALSVLDVALVGAAHSGGPAQQAPAVRIPMMSAGHSD